MVCCNFKRVRWDRLVQLLLYDSLLSWYCRSTPVQFSSERMRGNDAKKIILKAVIDKSQLNN